MSQRSRELWSVLEMFWGKEETEKLQELIFGPPELRSPEGKTLINNLGNLITLSKQCHAFWNYGDFALKHIRGGSCEETTEMVLELEWLPKHPELGSGLVRVDQTVETTSISGLEECALISAETRQELFSGCQITLTTTNAELLPLPDERLIKLQWLLTRVLRMSGAAEVIDLEYDDTPMPSPMMSPVPSLANSSEFQVRSESSAKTPESPFKSSKYLAESSDTPPESTLDPSPTLFQKSFQDLHGVAPRFPMQRWLKKIPCRKRQKSNDETTKENFIGSGTMAT
jgi:hypothetical protein